MLRIEKVCNDIIKALILPGREGFVAIYSPKAPKVPVVKDWSKRFCIVPESFKNIADRVYNLDVKEDDVWIVTSPKCGTTWMQEMVWLILHEYNFEEARKTDLGSRSPFLEFTGVASNLSYDSIAAVENLKSPRLIKSHLPMSILPKAIWTTKPKIIYVARNPKDSAISYFHHWQGMLGFKGTKEEFLAAYLTGNMNFGPFWPHLMEFWLIKDEPNVLFTSYERMQNDLKSVILEVCKFLDKTISDDQMEQLIDHLSFDKMKDNPACNHIKEIENFKQATGWKGNTFRFIRKGVAGGYKEEISHEFIEKFDSWTEENLKDFNLTAEEIF